MRPDTGPFLALSPFRNPVPLPVQDPDGSPNITITIACSWLPYIRGALLALLMQYTWPQDDPDQVYLAQQRANTLIAMFVECEGTIPPIACNYDFTIANTGWSPISPYLLSSWSSGNGWLSQFIDAMDAGWIYVGRVLTTPNVITRIEFTYNSTLVGSGANNSAAIITKTSGSYVITRGETVLAGTHTVIWTGSIANMTGVRLNVNSGNTEALLKITSAKIFGLSAQGCLD